MVSRYGGISSRRSVISYYLFPIPYYLLKSGRQYQPTIHNKTSIHKNKKNISPPPVPKTPSYPPVRGRPDTFSA